MKRFLAVMFILALFWVGGSWIGAQIEVTTSTVITIASRAVDDTGTYVTPDSVRIVVYREGVEAFDAWFEAADGECDELNDQLVFFDAFGDIDGNAGTGIYQVSANFKESDDEYWVNTWYNLVDTTDQTYGSIIYWKADSAAGAVADANKANFMADVDSLEGAIADANKANFMADVDSVEGAIADANKPNFMADLDSLEGAVADANKVNFKADLDSLETAIADANKPNFADTANQCDMVMISGDATAADKCEYFFDGTGIAQDLDIKIRSLEVTNDEGVAISAESATDAVQFKSTGTSTAGLLLEGTGTGGTGLEIYGHAAGHDVWLRGTGRIHGTIDRVTVADSTTAAALGSADADTLAVIRDYAYAVQESINAHAPHGDDWGQGGGNLAAITDTVNAILDSIQAHAPHGDDWSGAAGSNWSNAQRDSILAYIDSAYAQLDSFFAITFANIDSTNAYIDSAYALLDSFFAVTFANMDSANAFVDTGYAMIDSFFATTLGCAGSGLRTINIYVQNSADSSALQSFTVSVDDSSSQTFIGRLATDSDGLTTWGLDDDTYEITFSAAGWSITSPVYLTVTADDDTTYYATQYSPTPPSATYCTAYTYTYRLTGARSGCRLEARIPVEYGRVTSSTFVTIPYVVADTSEADGKVELNLVRSTLLTSSAGLTPVKMRLQLFDPDGNLVPECDTLMEIPDQASKKIW